MTFRKLKYDLTISPPPREYININYLYQSDIKIITTALRRCCDSWIIYPEFDNMHRLHYHGIIRISDPVKWVRKSRYQIRKIGYIKYREIKTFKSNLRWLLYISKDWSLTREILKIENPILYNKRHKRLHTSSPNPDTLHHLPKKNIFDWFQAQ